jgi:hypothetical protein
MAGDLGVTVGAAGLTVTVFALAYAIGAALLSAVLGARPPQQVLIGSLAVFGVFNVLSAPEGRSTLGGRDQAALVPEDHGLDAVTQVELGKDPPDVRADRAGRQVQLLGDLRV